MGNVSADDIRAALGKVYLPPEWYLGFEVGNSTGSNCRRHADAVAINAYPSKGFEIRGFEIKVSKQDLASELKVGAKSDSVAKYCDYWFLVVPKGLTDSFTLPPTWGVIEYQDGKLTQKIKATKLDKEPVTAGFLCAMLRGRERASADKFYAERREMEKDIRESLSWQQESATETLVKLRAKLEDIKGATGISLNEWTATEPIIAKLKAAQELDVVADKMCHIQRMAERMSKLAEEAQGAAEFLLPKSRHN